MKSVIIMILIVISFSIGITAFLWEQTAIAIIFSIILPILSLYILMSGRYQKNKKEKRKKKKDPVDNYFHPMEK